MVLTGVLLAQFGEKNRAKPSSGAASEQIVDLKMVIL